MAQISRTALFGKLDKTAYRAIESATVFCKLRGNPYVELVHWIHQILQLQDSDLHRIVRHFQLNPSNLARDVTHLSCQLQQLRVARDLPEWHMFSIHPDKIMPNFPNRSIV